MMMMTHPEQGMSAEELLDTYRALMSVIANHSPAALRHAARMIDASAVPARPLTPQPDQPGGTQERHEPDSHRASRFARAWLAFYGHVAEVSDGPGTSFVLTYPAHVSFHVRTDGGEAAAERAVTQFIDRNLASDLAIAAIPGPLPDFPTITEVSVWIGTPGESESDSLSFE